MDQNCTCTTRPWSQDETINGSLRYLVTEEIEEQYIVYGRTDRQTDGRTKNYRIRSTGLLKVELKYTSMTQHRLRFIKVADKYKFNLINCFGLRRSGGLMLGR